MLKFSVLLSLYYKENPSYLRQSLDSVFNQTCRPNEVVLVEDGPLTGDLNQVVDSYVIEYPEIKVITLPQNMGLGYALNEGLKHCSYDVVARMDTDDICKPRRFEKQLNYLEMHPDISVVSAWVDEFIDDPTNIVSTRKIPENHAEIYKFGQTRNPVSHPVVMFKKKDVLAVGNYKPFPLFEDYYLWSRMLVNGLKFHNIQESLLLFRSSSEMFQRRGGWKYACTEAKFQWELYKIGYIRCFTSIKNICIRFVVRIIPNRIRSLIYMNLLRK